MQTKTKYIHIRHWDYWWATYQLLEQNKPDSVEFSITNDKEGEDLFFHFDFYNLPALQNMMDADEYMERENPDYPVFEQKVEALKTGKLDYFVGSLYYPAFFPCLEFCNQPFAGGKTIFDAKAPVAAPDYAILFVREYKPLALETLKKWIERLTEPLFGEKYVYEFIDVPTKAQAQASYREEFTYLAFGRDKK